MNTRDVLRRYRWPLVGAFLLILGGVVGFVLYQKYKSRGTYFFLTMKKQISIPTENITKATLDNGMTILVFRQPAQPKVLVQIAYDIGSAVEQGGEKGLAHLIEHMIFKGTEKMAEGDIDAIARKYGALFNAYTSMDVTSYYFEVDKNNWKPFIPILADCMEHARFDEQHLNSELKAVIQELRMYRDSYVHQMIQKALELSFPPNHPYHIPIIGFKHDLVSVRAAELKNFYDRYYTPAHATLFVIGDVDPEEVIAKAKEDFGSIPKGEDYPMPALPALVPDLESHTTKIYREVSVPQQLLYFRIPGLSSDEIVAGEAVDFVLGSGESALLHKRLVDEEQVATGVQVGMLPFNEGGLFYVYIQPMSGKLDRCKELVAEEIEKFIEKGPDNRALSRMVNTRRRSFLHMLENPRRFAHEWIDTYFATRDEFALFTRINDLIRLTPQAVSAFAKDYLDPIIMNDVRLLPTPKGKEGALLAARLAEDALDLEILKHHVRIAPLEEAKYINTVADRIESVIKFPKPGHTFTLDNGLTVALCKNGTLPFITAQLGFRDSAYVAQTKEGAILSLMMNMLIEGSRGITKDEVVERFEDQGAGYAYTSRGAYLSCLTESFPKVFEHFARVLLKPSFSKDALGKLRAIDIDEYERAKSEPRQVASRILKNAVYPNHPFNWTFDEIIELLRGLSVGDLEKLHKKYISPSGMVLTLVGDVDYEATEKLIRKCFDKWSGPAYKNVSKTAIVPVTTTSPIDYYMVRDQAVLMMGRPSAITIYDEDYLPLKVLNYICWYSLGSRLFELREQTGLFYTAQGSWPCNACREHGYDFIMAILNVDNLTSAQEKLSALITNIAKGNITEDEFEVSKALYAKSILDKQSSNGSIASELGAMISLELGFDYYDKQLERLSRMTLDELNTVAQKYYSVDTMYTIRVGRIGNR